MPHQKKYVVLGVIFLILILVLVGWVILSNRSSKLSQINPTEGIRTQSPTPATATENISDTLPTQPPPLASGYFPKETISYPAGWPASLRFPPEFRLLEANIGSVTANSPVGYAAKLRFDGQPKQAEEKLTTFFTSQDWQIYQKTALDSGGFLLIILKNNKAQQGILEIDNDPDNPGQSILIATVSLQ